jgi:hypothetical protein
LWYGIGMNTNNNRMTREERTDFVNKQMDKFWEFNAKALEGFDKGEINRYSVLPRSIRTFSNRFMFNLSLLVEKL